MAITVVATFSGLGRFLWNLFPGFSCGCVTDGNQADVVTMCQVFQRRWRCLLSFLSDLGNFVSSKFGQMLVFSLRPFTSSFLDLVIRIGFIVTKKKVGRSYAKPVVTAVKDELTLWNWPMLQLPSNTMRSECCMHFTERVFGINKTITSKTHTACPLPTPTIHMRLFGTLFIDPSPKPGWIGCPQGFFCSTRHQSG